MKPVISSCLVYFLFQVLFSVTAQQEKQPGFQYQRNPDGSISGSFGFSQALTGPGTNGAFGASQTFSFGPKGASFGGSHSASVNGPGGHNFGFSNSNAASQNFGPNGFGSSGSNSQSSHNSNPLFSSSNANANAFANQVNFNNPFPQQPFPFNQPTGPRRHRPFGRYNRF